jgi:hypothetical protein
MKSVLKRSLSTTAGLLLVVSAAFGDEVAVGSIAKLHLNGAVATRGVCIQMQPVLSGTGWACLYQSHALYKETTATLLAARMAEKTCFIAWGSLDADGHKIISLVEC